MARQPPPLRIVLWAVALGLAIAPALGADLTVRESVLPGNAGDVALRCYATAGDDARPVVLLLHGASGFAPFSRHYERHADALARRGMRVCAVLYYSADDARIIADRGHADRGTLFQRRFMDWAGAVHGAVDHVSALPTTERGAIGILGFSQGAYLAVAVAGTHRRVKALATFYGGFPFALEGQIHQLPATLIVHGEADAVIPVQEAHAMEAIARMRAATYTLRLYPGAGHGFDGAADDPQAVDARRLATDFFVLHLKPGTK